jgi:hypothetical protein
MDITEEIVKILNKNKPKVTEAPTPKPEKKEEPKKEQPKKEDKK